MRKGLVSNRITHSKNAIKGVIHKLPITPVKTRPSTIKNPQGSSLPKAMDWRAGNKPARMRPPSSGGNGNRLKTSKPRFQEIPACDMEIRNFSFIPRPTRAISKMSQMRACAKLEPGPASATQMESILGLRRRPKFTGTGFA